MKDWDSAGKAYTTILVERREGRPNAEADIARIYNRLGIVLKELGHRKKALGMFEKALELDPHHRETLLAVIELQTALGDWEAVVRAKRGLVATADDAEKTKLLEEVGALYQSRLQHAPKATAAYLEALELAPDAHQLLQKLLDLYIDTKQWKKAVETIERFVALEQDPFKKGLYFHAAATLCRDELKSLDEAVDYYDCALDSFFAEAEQARRADAVARAHVVPGDRRGAHDQARLEGPGARLPRHDQAAPRPTTRASTSSGSASSTGSARSIARVSSSTQRRARCSSSRSRWIPTTRSGNTPPIAPRSSRSSTWSPAPIRPTRRSTSTRACCAPSRSSTTRTRRSRTSTGRRTQYDKYWCLCSTLAFLQEGRRRRARILRAVQAARARQGQARDDPGQLGQARAPRREPLHLGDLRRVLAGRRGDERVPAQGLRRQARGAPPAPHRRPDVQQAVRATSRRC